VKENPAAPSTPIVNLVYKIGPIAFLAWIFAGILAIAALLIAVREIDPVARASVPTPIPIDFGDAGGFVGMPQVVSLQGDEISREVVYQTEKSDLSSFKVIVYQVDFGDALFGIAADHGITPETLLWANEDALGGNPDMLEPEMTLLVPPVDGVYYKWKEGDTLTEVAEEYEATVDDILNWPGNKFSDLTNPFIEPNTYIMIPNGVGEFRQWIIPVIASGSAGVSPSLYGGGACSGSYSGTGGTGAFAWPSQYHEIVGNDYWDGHLAIDIRSGEGLPVLAADSGVVVFSGWATGGYGNMVMIDHQNGYHTLYAHLSSATAGCGRSVGKGSTIGWGGSTGQSTGPHLHFEVRYLGGFVNPWYVLPAP
jgi:LysM repeat protein